MKVDAKQASPGPGWWLASDGRWYPPEQAPGPPTLDSPEQDLPVPRTYVVVSQSNGLAVAAVVLGAIGVLFGLLPIGFLMAWILGVLALVFGLSGRAPGKPRRNLATWGAVLGAVAIVLGTIGVTRVDEFVVDLDAELNRIIEEQQGEPG